MYLVLTIGLLSSSHIAYSKTNSPPTNTAPGTAILQNPDSLADALLEAAKTNDTVSVKRLISQGAPINSNKNNYSALAYACQKKNFDLARWLVDQSAEIGFVSIITCDMDNHLPSCSLPQKQLLAHLICSKLRQKGMQLPKADSKAEVEFVERCKEAVVNNLKGIGYWPKDVTGWVVRCVDVNWMKEDGKSLFMRCDVATWNGGAMFELVSKTSLVFTPPPRTNGGPFSHVWVYGGGDTTVLSTTYDRTKVLNGDFVIYTETKDGGDKFIARHLDRKALAVRGEAF